MRYNALTPGIGSLEGTGRGYYINPLGVQEVVVDLGTMGSAEYSLGGAQVAPDRAWCFATGRRWGTTTAVANTYFDANPNDFVFSNDLSRPLYPSERDGGAGGRATSGGGRR